MKFHCIEIGKSKSQVAQVNRVSFSDRRLQIKTRDSASYQRTFAFAVDRTPSPTRSLSRRADNRTAAPTIAIGKRRLQPYSSGLNSRCIKLELEKRCPERIRQNRTGAEKRKINFRIL
ncbi:Hypothetical predicted protein [Scomber scombrus]|uniref:Uncharacterized protein n=1 Tax=Scomber scombrus TaxID=13677 RepID=A0AAV1NRT6_SCOSC